MPLRHPSSNRKRKRGARRRPKQLVRTTGRAEAGATSWAEAPAARGRRSEAATMAPGGNWTTLGGLLLRQIESSLKQPTVDHNSIQGHRFVGQERAGCRKQPADARGMPGNARSGKPRDTEVVALIAVCPQAHSRDTEASGRWDNRSSWRPEAAVDARSCSSEVSRSNEVSDARNSVPAVGVMCCLPHVEANPRLL